MTTFAERLEALAEVLENVGRDGEGPIRRHITNEREVIAADIRTALSGLARAEALLAAERAKALEKERAELEKEAERLAGEIEELAGEAPTRIG